jgi:hypothetical protein
MTKLLKRLSLTAVLILITSVFGIAQQRPLLTEDVEIIKPGVIRIETGFEFVQDQRFPLSGLRGDLTRLGNTRLSFGLAPNVEFQIEWTLQNFLSVKGRDVTPLNLKLGANGNDANDFGDATLWMKIKLKNESRITPSLGFRFGMQLPNSNETKGIGTNTTNVYGMITAAKHFDEDRLEVFGNLGAGILQTPLSTFSQNDVLLYGLAGIYKVSDTFNLVGEINGRHSTRRRAPLGTEDYSEARIGGQLRALGVRWNAAGIFGISKNAPKTGLSLGVTYDWDAFTPVK